MARDGEAGNGTGTCKESYTMYKLNIEERWAGKSACKDATK